MTKVMFLLAVACAGCGGGQLPQGSADGVAVTPSDIAPETREDEPWRPVLTGYAGAFCCNGTLERAEEGNLALKQHVIRAGSNVAIGLRRYADLSGTIDDEFFDKLTIELRALPDRDSEWLTFSSADFFAYLSRGASAWPETWWHGRLADGWLRLRRGEGDLGLEVEGQLTFRLDDPTHFDELEVAFECSANRSTSEELSAWEGGTSGSGHAAYPPRDWLDQHPGDSYPSFAEWHAGFVTQ